MGKTAVKGFCMFFDWMDTLSYLTPKDYKDMMEAIGAYYTEGKDMVENVSKSSLKALAHNIMRQIERMEESSEDKRKAAEASHESRRSKKKPENLQCSAVQVQNVATDTDTDTDTDTEKETLSPPASPFAVSDSVGTPLKERISSKQLEEEFDRLWKVYPRKEGKKGAKAAFEKVRKRGVTFEEIERGVKRYAEVAGQREMKYIKHGSTWFAGECWNDEVKEDGYRRDAESESYDYYAALLADTFL